MAPAHFKLPVGATDGQTPDGSLQTMGSDVLAGSCRHEDSAPDAFVQSGICDERHRHGLSAPLVRQLNSLCDAFASKQIQRAFLQ
jgi:hypothetical protein